MGLRLDRALLAPLAAVRRRLRWQAALDRAAQAALVGGLGALVAVNLWRLHLVGDHGLCLALAAALALVPLGALVGALARQPLDEAARRADVSHDLADRLRSALAFAGADAPTPFMQAAIADATRAAAAVAPGRAAPLARPRALGPAALVAVATALVAFLRFPTRPAALVHAPPPPRLTVEHALLEPEREAAAALLREAQQGHDRDTQALADELNRLVQELDNADLTRKQAFDKLAELENKYLHAGDGQLDDLKRKLKKAGDELARAKLLREVGEALKADDPAAARKELEKLAAEAEAHAREQKVDAKWDQKQREEAARALANAAKLEQQSAEEKKRRAEEQRLREEERRLKRELAQKPNDQELQRRLQRNQRELERLERERQERAEQQRQLERLQRELQKAAEEMRQKLSPETLKRLAEQMRNMEDEMRKLGSMERARLQIAELKEVLRRAGKSGDGQGQGQGKDGQAQANGKDGKKGKNGQALEDFEERAGGKKRSDILILDGKQHGNGPVVLLPLPMGPGQQRGGQGEGKDNGQGGRGDEPPHGDGIGDQHDPNLKGPETQLDSQRHATRVEGKQGAGPSRSETILTSSEKGFATRNYQRVYRDYTAVMEEVMSKENVPPGYRYYIKRYFQLIKPRE